MARWVQVVKPASILAHRALLAVDPASLGPDELLEHLAVARLDDEQRGRLVAGAGLLVRIPVLLDLERQEGLASGIDVERMGTLVWTLAGALAGEPTRLTSR